MTTDRLLRLADEMLHRPLHRQSVLDFGVMEQEIIDHARRLAHDLEGLLAKSRCGDAATHAWNIADLLRMQSRLATRIHELRQAAA